MATQPILPEDEYEPIQVPQGGLLNSTVGTPLNPLPPVDPATAYNQPTTNITPDVYENDDVVARVVGRRTDSPVGNRKDQQNQGQ